MSPKNTFPNAPFAGHSRNLLLAFDVSHLKLTKEIGGKQYSLEKFVAKFISNLQELRGELLLSSYNGNYGFLPVKVISFDGWGWELPAPEDITADAECVSLQNLSKIILGESNMDSDIHKNIKSCNTILTSAIKDGADFKFDSWPPPGGCCVVSPCLTTSSSNCMLDVAEEIKLTGKKMAPHGLYGAVISYTLSMSYLMKVLGVLDTDDGCKQSFILSGLPIIKRGPAVTENNKDPEYVFFKSDGGRFAQLGDNGLRITGDSLSTVGFQFK